MASLIRSFYNECRYIIDSIGSPETKSVRATIEKLNELQRLTKYQFQTLQAKKSTRWKDFWRILLKDAEQLCKNGQPDLALEALNGAKESGLTSPWTEASRARAYEKLHQWPKALEIWGELTTCKNKDVKKIAIRELNNHQSKVNSLTSDLITTIQQSGNEAKFLPKITPTCLQELEDPILAEVASLQESKSLKLSAKILKKSIAAGLSTPTIKEKLAILLCTLERENEAIALWQSLLSSKNITVKRNAEKMLKQISNKFLNTLHKIISNAGQPILHLPDTTTMKLSELESSIIKEADALRNTRASNIALQVLDTSIKWGIDTDMIKAKKARTLLSMKKTEEACILLTPLLDSRNKKAREMAKNMLERHPEKAEKVKIDLEIEKIFSKIKNVDKAVDSAVEMLTDKVLDDPKNEQLHKALQEVAIRRSTLNAPKGQHFNELIDHRQKRAGLEAFLGTITKRYHNKSTKSPTDQSQ
mgnify:CR=1 FL=1